MHRAAVGVVGGVGDELILRRKGEALVDRIGVVGLENALVAIIELAVTDQEAKAARGQEVPVGSRKSVDRAANAERVAGASPIAALDRQAAGETAIDIGKRQDLVLAVVPAGAGKQADILDELLLEIGGDAVFQVVVTNARYDIVDIERRVHVFDRQPLAIIAGVAAIAEHAEPQ